MADTQQQQQQPWGQQQPQQQTNGAYPPPQQQQAQQPALPFPTLLSSVSPPQPLPAAGGPGSWGAPAAPFPNILPPTLASGAPSMPLQQHPSVPMSTLQPQPIAAPQSRPSPPIPTFLATSAQSQQSQQPPRLGAHVPVPASLLQSNDDDDMPPREPVHSNSQQQPQAGHGPSAAGHSHDGVACGHSHAHSSGNSSPTNNGLARSGSQTVSASSSFSSPSSTSNHGHSHGPGSACGGDHGHSHGASPARKAVPPVSWEEPVRPAGPWRRRLVKMIGVAWFSGGDSRAVLLYISSKLCMVLLQLWWGLIAGNMGMVSSSFHTAFDVLALGCALFAMLNAKYPARAPFSYGLDRQEVVAAFTNAVFLFFVATFMIIETFHTAYAPPELEQSDVGVALAGLAADALGIALFAKYMSFRQPNDFTMAAAAGANSAAAALWSHGGGASAPLLGSGSTGSSAGGPLLLGVNNARGHYENMHGVALHVLADLVGHASLLSAVWIKAAVFPNFSLIFPLSFLASALLTIKLVLPLFRATGAVLLMTTPSHLRLALDRAMREVSFYDGVLEMRAAHWWTHAPGVVVGSMHVRIRADANEQTILTYVHSVLRKYCALLTVQVEKDQMPQQWTTHMLQG